MSCHFMFSICSSRSSSAWSYFQSAASRSRSASRCCASLTAGTRAVVHPLPAAFPSSTHGRTQRTYPRIAPDWALMAFWWRTCAGSFRSVAGMRRAACAVTYSHVLPRHMSTHVESVQNAGMLLRAMAGPSAMVQDVMIMWEVIFGQNGLPCNEISHCLDYGVESLRYHVSRLFGRLHLDLTGRGGSVARNRLRSGITNGRLDR